MTWAEFKLDVLTFLDVDSARRGIEAFRTAYIKAGVSDLVNYVPAYDTGVAPSALADSDVTPFDSPAAQAVAEYVKSKITRNVDRDLQLSQAHLVDYMTVRRRLFAQQSDDLTPILEPFIGKLFVVTLNLRLKKMPCPILGNVWLTVKHFRGVGDPCAVFQLQRGEGIAVLDEDASRIEVTMTAEQTALLSNQYEYFWDVEVETPLHRPVFPINGKLKAKLPVTRIFAETLMGIDGTPLFFIGTGIPISKIT